MQKCLQFQLPSGSGGMAAGMTRGGIQKKLRELVNNKKIGSGIKTKTKGYKFKVWLENEIDYTVFFLVWESTNPWHRAEVIEEDYVPDQS